jgi:hypothetical protein
VNFRRKIRLRMHSQTFACYATYLTELDISTNSNCQKGGQDSYKKCESGISGQPVINCIFYISSRQYNRNSSCHTVLRTKLTVTLSLNLEETTSPHDASRHVTLVSLHDSFLLPATVGHASVS